MAQRLGRYFVAAYFIVSMAPAHADDTDALPTRKAELTIKKEFTVTRDVSAGFQEGDKIDRNARSNESQLSSEKPWVLVTPNWSCFGKNVTSVHFEPGEKYTVFFGKKAPNPRYHLSQVRGEIRESGEKTAKVTIVVSIPSAEDAKDMSPPTKASFEESTQDWMELKVEDASGRSELPSK